MKRNCSESINDLVCKKKDRNFKIARGPVGHLKEKRDRSKLGGVDGMRERIVYYPNH